MLRAELTANGVWTFLLANPEAVQRERILTIVKNAQKQAFDEWTKTVGGSVGLALRFRPEAFGVLQLTRRSTGYQTRQIKTLGSLYPYVAPLSKKTEGNTSKPSGQMRNEILGGGYNIQGKNTGNNVATTQLSITGARTLNLLGTSGPQASGKGPIYRREFLGFDRGGRRDAEWLVKRANELTQDMLLKELQNGGRQKVADSRQGAAA